MQSNIGICEHEFFVVMMKRKDGFVYCDLGKCVSLMHLTKEDAFASMLWIREEIRHNFHVVKMVARVEDVCNDESL